MTFFCDPCSPLAVLVQLQSQSSTKSFITYWLIHYYAFNFNNYFYQNCIEQIYPFHIHNYLVFSRIVAGSFSEKFSYTSHVFQWEIQLAMSDFQDYQKTVWQVICLSEGIQIGCIRFPGLPENCMTSHKSFRGNSDGCIILMCKNSECNMIFIVVKIQSNISVTNLALLKVQEIQVLVLCLFQGITIC